MTRLHRILAGLSLILLLSGAAGVLTGAGGALGGSRKPAAPTGRPTPTATPTTTATTSMASSTTAPPGAPGPSSAALESGLVTPTDMGGYYRVVPAFSAALITSSPCLGPLAPAPAQNGRALTGLLGPDQHSVPAIVEDVASYPGTTATTRFEAASAALGACPVLSFDFGGPTVAARLTSVSIPPVGDADRVWAGSFMEGGYAFTIELGVVLHSDQVLALIWIDSSPPSDPVMGSFASTLSVAIGKLA